MVLSMNKLNKKTKNRMIYLFAFVTLTFVISIFSIATFAGTSWPVLKSGSSGDNVCALQYLLNFHGYTLSVDGDFGSNTQSAVKSFQSKMRLSSDGVVGSYTWLKLVSTVKNGSNNSAVKAVQYLLNKKAGCSLAVDGAFGSLTEQSVRNFQNKKGISVDGVVGPTTWSYLIGYSSSSSKMIPNVYNIMQSPELPNGCEITSLTILLNYYGFNVDKLTMSDKFLPQMEFYYVNGVRYGADVQYKFAGNPRSTYNSFGCFAPCITTAARNYLSSVGSSIQVANITGTGFYSLFNYVDQNNPVLIWGTIGMGASGTGGSWILPNGSKYTWKTNEHCLVLIGYNYANSTVTVADPMRGIVSYDMSTVKYRYEQMGSNAVILKR